MHESEIRETLYEKYEIDSILGQGKRSDALGDLYEEYVKTIFVSEEIISNFNSGASPLTTEEKVFYTTLREWGIMHVDSLEILDVSKREKTNGSAKTDVCLLVNGAIHIKLSVKHSGATYVTVAEFDVDTIKNEAGIKDSKLISLMEKHQRDNSAKRFTANQKEEMRKRLSPVKKDLVMWALSGSPDVSSDDIRNDNHTIMFKIFGKYDKYRLRDFSSHTIEKQVDMILEKKSGFGTGLSWTYATGTKGKKIQFKCQVM